MSLSKKANRKRMRAYRKAQVEYVHGLETRVLALEAENTLMTAILSQAEYTGYPLQETSSEARLNAIEARQAQLSDKVEWAYEENSKLKAALAIEQQRNTQLEADLARIEMMMDSMLREGDLS